MGGHGEVLALVRLRHGVVGESRRVCHVLPVPAGPAIPARLTALCGEVIVPGEAEVLDGVCGMPCHPCLMAAPRQDLLNAG